MKLKFDGYAPVRGKCIYWREALNGEDEFNLRIKSENKRVECSCFVLGDLWHVTVSTVPSDCPEHRRCRYYIKGT